MSLTVAPINGTPFIGGNAPGDLQVDSSGLQRLVKHNIGAGSDPTTGDDSGDGYAVGSRWWTTAGKLFFCDDASVGAAVWTQVNPTGGGDLSAADIDTLAKLNAIVTDATLIDTGDSRLSDARTPTSHASSHASGGGDAIKLDDLAAPDDNTDLNATTSAHGLLLKLGGGTTNFLRADGTWNAPPSGGLTKFTEAESTSSPNNTVYVDSLTAAGASTNVDFAIVPKGTGAIVATVPDSTATGGNKRGSNAVDFQVVRSSATQVASGYTSVVVGGLYNKSTSNGSVVVGGRDHTAGGAYSFVGGGNWNTCDGTNAIIGGGSGNSTTSTNAAICGGANNAITGNYASILGGGNNAASASYSCASGKNANANKYGQMSHASGQFSASGDAQISTLIARKSTTDATPIELFLDGSSEVCTIANDTTWAFTITVVARRTDANDESAAYKFEGCIDRNASAATTAIVGSVTKTVLAEDTAAWDCDVTADTTNGALKITVTGEASKTIRWVARIELTEVTG